MIQRVICSLVLGLPLFITACGSSCKNTAKVPDTTTATDTIVVSDVQENMPIAPDVVTAETKTMTPSDHTDDQAGSLHKPGKNDPLNTCTTCHGSSLKGGTGQSCYTCHNANDHTSKYQGVAHKSGSRSSCKTCHGPSNNGGLGQACNNCH